MSTASQKLPRVGEVLSTIWQGYKKHYHELWKLLLPYVIIAIYQGIYASTLINLNNSMGLILMFISTIALVGVSTWIGLVLIRAMYQVTMTNTLNIDKAKKNIAYVLWPYIAVTAIVGLIILAGSLFLIIPGIILAIMFFGASYATVIDGMGIPEALNHSLKITKGHKWDIFVLLFLTGSAMLIVYLVITFIVVEVLADIGYFINANWSLGLSVIGHVLISGMFLPIWTGIFAMVYGHLNKLTE